MYEIQYVATKMRQARVQDGKRYFTDDNVLSPQQIFSYFSRFSKKRLHIWDRPINLGGKRKKFSKKQWSK